QYAAARLRLGIVVAAQGRRDEALLAFAEAARLYVAASDIEGEAEVCIRRGLLLDAMANSADARRVLERARALTPSVDDTYYRVQADMALSSVTVSDGNYAEAERLASGAVQAALDGGLDTVAAEGLVGVAIAMQVSRPVEAATLLRKSALMAD